MTKATAAYLQVKELASGHVEVLLDALLAGAAAPSVYPGQAVALDIVNEPKKHGNKGVDQVDGECSQLLHVQQAHNIAAAAAKERQKERTGVPLLRPCSGRSFLPTCSKAKGEPTSRQLELGARCGSKVAIYDADPHEAKQLLHQLKRNETPARYSESEAVRVDSQEASPEAKMAGAQRRARADRDKGLIASLLRRVQFVGGPMPLRPLECSGTTGRHERQQWRESIVESELCWE